MSNIIKPNSETEYGPEYKKHYLEIYKLYVESADTISSRRHSANSFFLAINTVIMGAIGYGGINGNGNKLGFMLSFAGIFLCFYWYSLIKSYRQMNSGKFKIILEIEKELPISPYGSEWDKLGKGENPKLYKPFTSVEQNIPLVLSCFYLIYSLYALISFFQQ